MRLGITGTYSSGKTMTSLVLGHYLGLPRTEARTMREILPEAAPGKDLEQCTSLELIQMIVIRHMERVVHEHDLSPVFISDGCSLQEWIYGSVRVVYGINPNASISLQPGQCVARTDELAYFEAVMGELGKVFKRHVKNSFDLFVHLPNELPLTKDGHRPVNELFRSASDGLLKAAFDELAIPYYIVGGSIEERAKRIAGIIGRKPVMSISDAVGMAQAQYDQLIM
ncbi:AAA family ATPase [Herbaspirillum sp. C7C8]|uniref:AAA family ATPase n=1 Tax=Herbaspirillum sp. C7C8 TaxID=2736665 RepID=UPI001F52239B|nr:AAA family ATPase [Herbaspirillum sp. C7C8]MCI1005616.1 AAA family ATPase [Herbaspirillum sp. C7C8]